MKLDQLRGVVAIAESGAIRAAARQLGVPQPLLTRNLANLERELGQKLFERQTRGVLPTRFGAVVIDGARKVLNEVDQLSVAISQHNQAVTPKTGKAPATKRGVVPPIPRDPDRADHVFLDIVFEIFRLHGRIMKAGDLMVRPIGLTSSRWQVLGSLPHNKASVSEIARYMGLQRQSVQRTIDVLRRDGLVELVNNPNHQRAKLAVLTPSGASKIREVNKIRDEWIRRSVGGFSATELDTAHQFLRRLRTRLGRHSLP